ncbi:MAG: DUF1697 domain-containing protein [Fibrobacter sp.]|nr:DUF1697 domain-containing protein [Fibrobacter sp.]
MADLQSLFSSLGFNDILTYLQSGNMAFSTNLKSTSVIEQKIEEAISAQLKLNVEIICRSHDEIHEIIAKNPFAGKSAIESLYVTIFKKPIDSAGVVKKEVSEQYSVTERCIYLYCPNGYGRTKMNNTNLEKVFKSSATTRNWKTMMAIQEML